MSDTHSEAQPSEAVDQEVLRLRGEGRPYARISRELGLDRGADAQRAFVRALSKLSVSDAKRVRTEELSRLDRLAAGVRDDAGQSEIDRTRRLKTIERLRTQVEQVK